MGCCFLPKWNLTQIRSLHYRMPRSTIPQSSMGKQKRISDNKKIIGLHSLRVGRLISIHFSHCTATASVNFHACHASHRIFLEKCVNSMKHFLSSMWNKFFDGCGGCTPREETMKKKFADISGAQHSHTHSFNSSGHYALKMKICLRTQSWRSIQANCPCIPQNEFPIISNWKQYFCIFLLMQENVYLFSLDQDKQQTRHAWHSLIIWTAGTSSQRTSSHGRSAGTVLTHGPDGRSVQTSSRTSVRRITRTQKLT